MNINSGSLGQQPIKFQGNVIPPVTPPTLTDVMTRLAQVQQNQAQILKAVQTLQANQIRMARMTALMFEATSVSAPSAHNLVISLAGSWIQDMTANAQRG